MPPLPSLHALRIFEVVARHLSFTKAAAELCMTQGAASQQVKLLEGQLGVPLFRRLGRRLLLTDGGQELASGVGDALVGLHRAVERVRRHDVAGTLTVTMMPSFAAGFLVSRLGRFLSAWPQIDLRLHTSGEAVNLRASDIDVAIRHGRGPYPGLHSELVAREEIFPVCAPQVARRLNGLGSLTGAMLIRDHGLDWSGWLRAAGAGDLQPRGPAFLDSHLALQASADGQGIALGRTVIAADHLHAGRLVRPFSAAMPAPEAYWLLCLPERSGHPRIVAFRDWLVGEIEDVIGLAPQPAPPGPDDI